MRPLREPGETEPLAGAPGELATETVPRAEELRAEPRPDFPWVRASEEGAEEEADRRRGRRVAAADEVAAAAEERRCAPPRARAAVRVAEPVGPRREATAGWGWTERNLPAEVLGAGASAGVEARAQPPADSRGLVEHPR